MDDKVDFNEISLYDFMLLFFASLRCRGVGAISKSHNDIAAVLITNLDAEKHKGLLTKLAFSRVSDMRGVVVSSELDGAISALILSGYLQSRVPLDAKYYLAIEDNTVLEIMTKFRGSNAVQLAKRMAVEYVAYNFNNGYTRYADTERGKQFMSKNRNLSFRDELRGIAQEAASRNFSKELYIAGERVKEAMKNAAAKGLFSTVYCLHEGENRDEFLKALVRFVELDLQVDCKIEKTEADLHEPLSYEVTSLILTWK